MSSESNQIACRPLGINFSMLSWTAHNSHGGFMWVWGALALSCRNATFHELLYRQSSTGEITEWPMFSHRLYGSSGFDWLSKLSSGLVLGCCLWGCSVWGAGTVGGKQFHKSLKVIAEIPFLGYLSLLQSEKLLSVKFNSPRIKYYVSNGVFSSYQCPLHRNWLAESDFSRQAYWYV